MHLAMRLVPVGKLPTGGGWPPTGRSPTRAMPVGTMPMGMPLVGRGDNRLRHATVPPTQGWQSPTSK
ncbi:hypothetical protein B296_00009460 [Ensete ventricosum]|uniref:Uncharacterized protein n=1 Tax=Ensete ventricosum TaxID=4639 RepID=A0A427AZF9_ENSVE|nr:hypothetical protein B296_00009460 [Ensete ventricosum]